MGIQINGNTDTISAIDGSLAIQGASGNVTGDLTGNVTGNVNSTGVSTFSGGVVVAAGTTAAPSISPTGDSNTGIFFPSADTIAFAEGGVEAARFDSSGNLGVGTVSPISARLHVFGGGGLTVERQTGGTIAYFKNTGTTTPNIAFQASGTTYTPYIGVNNDDLLFGTGSSGLERVRLDSSGRVTMPYQPSFQAFSSSNTPIGSGTNVLPFNATNFNVGSHYNTSTYRFTAPVAGVYLFSVNLNLYTAPGIMMPAVRINGSSLYYGSRLSGNISGDNNLNLIVLLSLSVNDYVEALSANQGSSATISNGAAWTRFEGRLLG